jgi:hypothetical protein
MLGRGGEIGEKKLETLSAISPKYRRPPPDYLQNTPNFDPYASSRALPVNAIACLELIISMIRVTSDVSFTLTTIIVSQAKGAP